jgi:hypothetical protein
VTRRRTALLGLLGLLVLPVSSGAEVQLWSQAGVTRALGADISFDLDQHLRLGEGGTELVGVMPQLGLGYRPVSWLTLGAGYRLGYERRRRGDMEVRHRFHVDGQARQDVGELRLRYRLRAQDRYRSRDGHLYSLRNRVGADWRGFDRWVPRLTVSAFHRLGGEGVERAMQFHKWRATARLRYDFDRRSVAGFYRLEVSRTHEGDPALHILGLVFQQEL